MGVLGSERRLPKEQLKLRVTWRQLKNVLQMALRPGYRRDGIPGLDSDIDAIKALFPDLEGDSTVTIREALGRLGLQLKEEEEESTASRQFTEEAPPALKVPVPRVGVIHCEDPRAPEKQVPVIAFYYPGREEPWDTLCNSGILGNFFPLPADEYVTIEPPSHPGKRHTFTTSEAAYQALKFWGRADEFARMSAQACYDLKKSLKGTEDETCAGYGSVWHAMRAVLEVKFRPGTDCHRALLATGDSLLVEHNKNAGRDVQWSDDRTGGGRNWLGLELMLLRDALTGQKAWTQWADDLLDLQTGLPKSDAHKATYQAAVTSAALAILAALGEPAGPG